MQRDSGDVDLNIIQNALPPVGSVIMYIRESSIPSGWLLCNGQAVSRTLYPKLFSIIGTTYGTGNGSTTFNVPDFRGRVALGSGTGSGLTARSIAATGGEETHDLTTSEIPSHYHDNFGMRSSAAGTGTRFMMSDGLTGSTINHTSGEPLSVTGGGDPHNVMNPFLVIAFIIFSGL